MPLIDPEELPESVSQPLVGSAEDWWNNACLNWAGKNWGLYADGYFRAARMLADQVCQQRHGQDAPVSPTVFPYRQYLELALKHIVAWASGCVGGPIDPGFSHSLLVPWAQIPRLCALMDAETGQVSLSAEQQNEIEGLLGEFEALDRTSYAFRYPVDRKGGHMVPADVTHLNLRQFRDHMDRLKYLLDQLEVAVDYFGEFYRGYEGESGIG